MARGHQKLSARRVEAIKAPGRYGDGNGLWLQISRSGTKSWLLRYMCDGRARQMGLGSAQLVSLKDARDRAYAARRQLLDRIDPIEARRATRVAERVGRARTVTFEACAAAFLGAHTSSWRNEKHAAQWAASLALHAYEVIGQLPVHAIDTALVTKVLEPIWTKRPETASRLRGRIERVLDWATVRGMRSGENPARWRGHLDKLLPSPRLRRVRHHPALPYADVSVFMADLRGHPVVSAAALEFTILTAVRTSEAIGARWPEIDLATRVWTVPAERTKVARELRVPLSERVMEILAGLPQEDVQGFVFVGARAGAQLSNMAMLELLRGIRPGITVHGFRSTFRDWAAERTNYAREVAEAALGHAIGDRVEAAYRRGDLFEKRRRLMRDWARYCEIRKAGDKQVGSVRQPLDASRVIG